LRTWLWLGQLPPHGAVLGKLTARKIDLGFLHAANSMVQESQGALDLDLAAEGPIDNPNVNASLRLKNGSLRLAGMSTVKEIEMNVTTSPGLISLESLRARSDGGKMSATGKVHFRSGWVPRDLSLTATFEL